MSSRAATGANTGFSLLPHSSFNFDKFAAPLGERRVINLPSAQPGGSGGHRGGGGGRGGGGRRPGGGGRGCIGRFLAFK